jgi:tetratricopeptide (TPR) repeat protein
MKAFMRKATMAAAGLALLAASAQTAGASDNKAMDADILKLAEHWATAKYLSNTDAERKQRMEPVAHEAEALASRYPGRVEAMIWNGIVTSERASLTWGLTALDLATKARDILMEAEKRDPKALDAGAPTSLGVLYYRVPGFPIGFGDNNRARQLLQEAVKNAPNGRDAHYFYADFLFEQGEYKEAEQVLKKALTLPSHPERPIWDANFPKVMEGLLYRVREKMKS